MTTEENGNPCVEITAEVVSSITDGNSNPRPVVQGAFNLGNWMTAYQAAQQQNASASRVNANSVRIEAQVQKKEEAVEEKFEGGWKSEGKERPVTPLVCPRCQWNRKNARLMEPDQELWCEPCINGKILGHDPDKSYRPPEPTKGTAASLSQTLL